MNTEEAFKILNDGGCGELMDARYQEERLSLHITPSIKPPTKNSAYSRFLSEYPGQLLPSDKAKTFEDLLTFPLSTTEISDEAFNHLSKMFHGQNANRELYFSSDSIKTDGIEYLKSIGETDFWSNGWFELYKVKPNSYLVVDLPETQTTNRPEPYFFNVPIENVLRVKNNHDDSNEYLFYKVYSDEKELVYQVDSEYYRVFENRGGWRLISEIPHDLGFSPSHVVYPNRMGLNKNIYQNEVTPNLGLLDWTLFSEGMKRHLEMYAGFPIISAYAQECNYKTADGLECFNGYIEHQTGISIVDDQEIPNFEYQPCPSCNGHNLMGAGSVFTAPPPSSNDEPSNIPGVVITSGDTNSIDRIDKTISDYKRDFFNRVLGGYGEAINDQAKNEKQVMSSNDSKHTVIMNAKRRLEKVESWMVSAICGLRYGKAYKGNSISRGDKFYLTSLEDMLEKYETSKLNGMPTYELESQRRNIIEKKYETSPNGLKRAQLLDKVEPLNDFSLQEILKNSAQFDPVKVYIKLNFTDLLDDFEEEYGDIVEFMSELEERSKISFIKSWMSQKANPVNEEDSEDIDITE